jgi:branched-chain amino acid transport system ATP-binding protein
MTAVETTWQPPAAGAGKRLEIEALSVDFGGLRALDAVSMHAEQGEVVGVIGPNGAGKTTLFNVICGFVRPRSGSVSYGGTPIGRHHPHDLTGMGIARTLQGVGLCRGMSVLDNVKLGAQAKLRADVGSALLGLARSSREERRLAGAALATLERLGIAGYAERMPTTLPYPVQKRVALARALVAQPSMLLLDEPASGLSDEEMRELESLIDSLTPGVGVLLVEHRMDLVNAVCDRIVVLNFGRVIAEGSPAQIRSDPEVAVAYLGRAVDPEAAATAGPVLEDGAEHEAGDA